MLVKTRERWLVNIAHLIVFYERHEKPECCLLRAVKEQRADNKVHALNIANSIIVAAECT